MPETAILTYTTKLTSLTCGSCGIPFAMPDNMLRRAQEDGRSFWCPNGDKISYTVTEAENLRKRIEQDQEIRAALSAQLTHEQDQRRAAERSAAAFKGQATKLRKRASAGVCPVPDCHRHFENLARHMHSKHPDFAEGDHA